MPDGTTTVTIACAAVENIDTISELKTESSFVAEALVCVGGMCSPLGVEFRWEMCWFVVEDR